MAKILLVEDNRLIREAVTECFAVGGHHVVAVESVKRALIAADLDPDAIILDIRLPDGSGYELAKRFRARSDVPIVFLTAKDSESERILGFEVGADDYVVKPFSAKELVLRVEAVLRRYSAGRGRAQGPGTLSSGSWTLGEHGLRIDAEAHRVYADEREVRLTESEWRILCALADRAGGALTREVLLDALGRPYDASERTIDTHVANIRARLGCDGWIETVRGYGYRFSGTLTAEAERRRPPS